MKWYHLAIAGGLLTLWITREQEGWFGDEGTTAKGIGAIALALGTTKVLTK